MPFVLIFSALLLAAALSGRWLWESWRHNRRIGRVQYRIHVNGIRGKSTATRIVAGILREAGLTTLAKTTGTAAAVISASATTSQSSDLAHRRSSSNLPSLKSTAVGISMRS